MIEKLLEEIQVKVNSYLNQQIPQPDTDANRSLLIEDISKHERPGEGVAESEIQGKIIATLVNIEEETTLKNNYPVRQVGNTFVKDQSTLYLNLYLLFSANYSNYLEGIKHLSRVIQFFQFNRTITFYLEEACEVKFNLHNIGFENLNNLWTVLGGKYLPSVIYRARVLMFQASPPASGAVITDIQGEL